MNNKHRNVRLFRILLSLPELYASADKNRRKCAIYRRCFEFGIEFFFMVLFGWLARVFGCLFKRSLLLFNLLFPSSHKMKICVGWTTTFTRCRLNKYNTIGLHEHTIQTPKGIEEKKHCIYNIKIYALFVESDGVFMVVCMCPGVEKVYSAFRVLVC